MGIFLSAWFIKTAVLYIVCVRVPLIIIAAIIGTAVLSYRIIKYLRSSGRWREDEQHCQRFLYFKR